MGDIIQQYTNGNLNIKLFNDGTRIINYDGEMLPDLPISMDIKITNKCDAACKFCHENSNPNGQHADLDKLLDVIEPLHSGTELPLGGGDPFSHPGLFAFLCELKMRKLIPSITINQKHVQKHQPMLLNFIQNKLIYGVGVSYSDKQYLEHIKPIIQATDNIVFHLIMGVNKLQDIEDLNNFCFEQNKRCKILILGYKMFGRGINYHSQEIEDNKYQWYIRLAQYFNNENMVISFDNLALNQLNLRRFFTDKGWNKFFQGLDGVATCYIDAVKQEFAKSSTSNNRVSFDSMSLQQYFQQQRNQKDV